MSSSLKSDYKIAVEQELADSANGVLRRQNNVAHYQRLFQRNDGKPVHLKGKGDLFIYRSMMRLSAVGIAVSLAALGMMATGKMKKQ